MSRKLQKHFSSIQLLKESNTHDPKKIAPTQKKFETSKKLFSRRPLNSSNATSRLTSSRVKTDCETHLQGRLSLRESTEMSSLLESSKNVKFITRKNSQSPQKLFSSNSSQDLRPTRTNSEKNLLLKTHNNINPKNDKVNNLIQNLPQLQKYSSELQIIPDDDEDKGLLPIQSSMDESEKSSKLLETCCEDSPLPCSFDLLSKQYRSSSFSQFREFTVEICRRCQEGENQRLQSKLEECTSKLLNKDIEIKALTKKLQRAEKNASDSEQIKKNLEYEIKLMKEREIFTSSQKEEIELSYINLQSNYNKVSQELRYKELQNNINKRYRKQCTDLEGEVQRLKEQLSRVRTRLHKLQTSSSMELDFSGLKGQGKRKSDSSKRNQEKQNCITVCLFCQSKQNGEKGQKFERLNQAANQSRYEAVSKRGAKQPRINKIYSEDTLFSLSSENSE